FLKAAGPRRGAFSSPPTQARPKVTAFRLLYRGVRPALPGGCPQGSPTAGVAASGPPGPGDLPAGPRGVGGAVYGNGCRSTPNTSVSRSSALSPLRCISTSRQPAAQAVCPSSSSPSTVGS